jgi:hypothetical protein
VSTRSGPLAFDHVQLAARLDDAATPGRWDTDLPGVARFYTEDTWGNRLELLVSS